MQICYGTVVYTVVGRMDSGTIFIFEWVTAVVTKCFVWKKKIKIFTPFHTQLQQKGSQSKMLMYFYRTKCAIQLFYHLT